MGTSALSGPAAAETQHTHTHTHTHTDASSFILGCMRRKLRNSIGNCRRPHRAVDFISAQRRSAGPPAKKRHRRSLYALPSPLLHAVPPQTRSLWGTAPMSRIAEQESFRIIGHTRARRSRVITSSLCQRLGGDSVRREGGG